MTDHSFYVTITIPDVAADFVDSDVEVMNDESIVDVATDAAFFDMDELVATFEIKDADGRTLRTVSGVIGFSEYGPALHKQRYPVVALRTEATLP